MTYGLPDLTEWLLAGAGLYRPLRAGDVVQEPPGCDFPYTERHLQALWFDRQLRPVPLNTSRGETVMVETPGRWNLEAGPDFFGTVLLLGRERRRLRGDAEIHVSPGDWKRHGHYADPRYAGVRFHITWFPGTVDPALFPPGTVHIALSDPCTADLESIDLSAYPYAEPRAAGHPLARRDPDRVQAVLEDAGRERLRIKAQRMVRLIGRRGAAQALYEETAAALGYRHNQTPFRRLARSLRLDALRAVYGPDWHTLQAVLLGFSGLLPEQPGSGWPPASKRELRSLWDGWWREQHKWEEAGPLNRSDWTFSSLRPLNHPVRRMAALAQWIARGCFETADAVPPASSVSRDGTVQTGETRRGHRACDFQSAEPCFWSTHLGWTGKTKRAELVGTGRLRAIELNVLLPYRLATGRESSLRTLPVEPMNGVIRATAYTLFGPDHSPKLYRTALARQGLLQIFHDFILTGRPCDILPQ